MKFRKQSYFKKIGDSIPKFIEKNVKQKNFAETSLIKNWVKIVGVKISNLCFPIKISFSNIENSNGVIYLKTVRGKSMEVEFKNFEIIEKVNQYLGYKAITNISVVQDLNFKYEDKKKKIVKNKIDDFSKDINKIKEESLKLALNKLNKTFRDK